MGALCGKESKDENFAGAGRPLGSAPPPAGAATSAPLPANKRVVGGPPRTLGGGPSSSAAGGDPAADARRKAAEAAEVCQLQNPLTSVTLLVAVNGCPYLNACMPPVITQTKITSFHPLGT